MSILPTAFSQDFWFETRAQGCRYMPCLNSHSNDRTLRRIAMPWKSWWKPALLFAALFLLAGNLVAVSAQTRPEAPPFDASRMTMQPPPPEGVAIRAGRLFDPRTGTNLANQVIVIQGERIADVGPGGPREDSRGRARDRHEQRDRAAGPDRPARAPDAEPGAERRARSSRGTALRAGGFIRRLYDAPGHEFALHLCDGRIAGRHQ